MTDATRDPVAMALEALKPFVAFANDRDAAYRKRGGEPSGFPDDHCFYGSLGRNDFTIGNFRRARDAYALLRSQLQLTAETDRIITALKLCANDLPEGKNRDATFQALALIGRLLQSQPRSTAEGERERVLEEAAARADAYDSQVAAAIRALKSHPAAKADDAAATELEHLRRAIADITKPIGMQDVRLMVGEGSLKPLDVLAGVEATLKMRVRKALGSDDLAATGGDHAG